MVRRSPRLVRFFTRHVKRFHLARNFHAVRLSRTRQTGSGAGRPVDRRAQSPLVVGPAGRPGADRVVSGPCPLLPHGRGRARALSNLRASGRVRHRARTTARGAREFLRTSRAILARPRTALWITAQGRFADARERPAAIQPGVAHLVTSPGTSGHSAAGSGVSLLARALPRSARPVRPAHRPSSEATDRTVAEWRTCIEAGTVQHPGCPGL